ncbi:MAG: DUF4331 family protein [Caldilineaceae bacterium]|nr:DUF4331 family protein [Caldilineaceae bacterium]
MTSIQRSPLRRIALALALTLALALLLAAVLIAYQFSAHASSHREAPLISKDPFADTTDVYMFISPENPANVVLAASWIPFQAPEGGPNYFEWDKTALYDIYVDNNGDASPDITYTLSSNVVVENPNTFLYNVGPIGLNGANWNRKQYITITEQIGDDAPTVLVGNKLAAPVNIGEKSTPNYESYFDAAVTARTTPQGPMKIFAGQTDDAFWVDLQVFDLLTLRGQDAPIGYTTGNNIPVDSLSGMNVHSLVIEAPIAHVTSAGEPVIGMWAGTRRSQIRVLTSSGGQLNSITYTQVSRLGMPLVNEVVIPMGLKDVFNSIPPSSDLDVYGLLQKSVEDPELATLLCALYDVPVPNPVNDSDQKCNTQFTPGTPRTGRGDIFDIFVTGIKLSKPLTVGNTVIPAGTNFTQPQTVRPAEMLRLNTAIHTLGVCPTTPARLGVLAGDLCGFPNGRRLADDVVEIELLAVAGAVYQLLDGTDANFTYNEALGAVLTDGVDYNDVPFYGASDRRGYPTTFPYMAPPHSGQAHWHINPFFNLLLDWVQNGAED